ncbi:PREDICTED: beta,beta-carotene 15,15'-monooxygenase [Apaloderma vittatum]|uniref:Beta,beta-carotene 15,15'-monooxygenase n=1 Tax=Apaloderma vittatum TaxID=57397 RepID=A0A091NM27_APAVI|nr:PREDICTED: beta,beta-carotene 15,15'-monooxygenase [Apaloderma vittatum]KFP90818.1 Beta,beta-carotene 15,15'-monooxygenase [Apaloderma vittatum]
MATLFARNKKEHPEPIKAEVRGQLPTWLQGVLIRNGPGMHTIGDTQYNHWFDGLALLHSFTFKNGEVYYRSKYLRSDTYNHNIEANRIVVSEFGTMAYPDPCKNIFAKAFSYLSHTIPEFTDNCLINIMRTGDDFYATSETNFIRKINPRTLETLDKVDYSKYVAVNVTTSHPHYDSDGNTLNMGTSIVDKGRTKYILFKIPPSVPEQEKKKSCFKHMEVVSSIPSRSLLHPSYYHSFGITENYIIFIEQPFRLDIVKMATAYMRGVTWASCLAYHKEDKTWFHFVDKQTKKEVSTKFYTDAMVFFHHVNAYEEDGHIIFDLIAYADNSLYEMFYLKRINTCLDEDNKLTSVPICKRFVVPLQYDKDAEVGSNLVTLQTTATAVKEKDGSIYCQPEILCEGIELPRINYDYNGKKYKYIFAAKVQWSPVPAKVAKFNIQTKEMLQWGEDNCWPSEPIFIPSPDAKEEDDGIVLTCILTSNPKEPPFLLVLDAKTFKELGRALVDIEMHLDLHGMFIPEKDLKTEAE